MNQIRRARIVLLSGGSASNELASSLDKVADVTNVITVFDNGGSTGELRKAFRGPAVGDLRNRLCALASTRSSESASLRSLFDFRLSDRKSQQQLLHELTHLSSGQHHLVASLSEQHRQDVMSALECGHAGLPKTFNLAGLSIGNLLLVGETARSGDLVAALEWARELLGVRSRVLPLTTSSLHLGAQLNTDQWLLGQAEITSESSRLRRMIVTVRLLEDDHSFAKPVRQVPPAPGVLDAIANADVIVFGFGSFFTSTLPHLLVDSVTDAIAQSPARRVFLCNPTADRETERLTASDMLELLCRQQRSGSASLVTDLVHFALGGGGDVSIPLGDLRGFVEGGGRVTQERDIAGFADIGRRAAEHVLAICGHTEALQAPTFASPASVVLFDLDHTLFDYSGLREYATHAALKTFCENPLEVTEFVLRELTPPLTDLLVEWGFPDLRRQWNSAAVYAWAHMAMTESGRGRLRQAFARCRAALAELSGETPFERRQQLARIAAEAGRHSQVRPLIEAAHGILSDLIRFQAASEAFAGAVGQRAALVPGAEDLIRALRQDAARVYVVTEGDTDIQLFKVEQLSLGGLVNGTVVTDGTLGVLPLLRGILSAWQRRDDVPRVVRDVYNSLHPYTEKSRFFYSKLIHAIVAQQEGQDSLQAQLGTTRFLTESEWSRARIPQIAMVGDSYIKDVEPFLRACPQGSMAARVVSGKYAAEEPLHEIVGQRRPLPVGYFPNLSATTHTLLSWIERAGPPVLRPVPVLPAPDVFEEFAAAAGALPGDAVAVVEAFRVQGEPNERAIG